MELKSNYKIFKDIFVQTVSGKYVYIFFFLYV